jgi:hypothetical protein
MRVMQSWVSEELQHAKLGDKRLDRRLSRIVEALAAQPTASVPEASGTWAATKAVYRFWDSPEVTAEAIRATHIEQTTLRVRREETVLAIQDTTNLDFTHHPATTGLGPLDNIYTNGLKVHSSLAVSMAGVPLGLLHQEIWVRDRQTRGRARSRRKRPTADKESQRWLTALSASQQAVPAGVRVVTVADSEADIYDLFALERRAGSELLIRGTHDRRVDDTARYLWAAVRQAAVAGQRVVEVHRRDGHAARQAILSVRFVRLSIVPPRHHLGRGQLQPVELTAILAEEDSAPVGVEPICWLLLTSLAVATLADAERCVEWYSLRWLIERYHFVLKSGCRLEELQLAKAARLERAVATYCIVAWRLLWLSYEARRHPDLSCATVLETHEWQALFCITHHVSTPPEEPPSLHQAVRWIAQLGGFLGRTGDGEPGVKVIWRGLQRLNDIAAAWLLAHTATNSAPQNPSYG